LDGQSIAEAATLLFKFCTSRNLTVGQALEGDKWIRHFKRNLPNDVLMQFMGIFNKLQAVQLQHGTPDSVTWR
jgi:hypothetical protein